jgi:hypothetical protein
MLEEEEAAEIARNYKKNINALHINSYTTTSMLCTLIYFENGTCPSTYII